MALRAPFADLLDADPDDPALAALRRTELIGRPLGDRAFQDAISRRLGRAITPGKPGPKPKRERDGGRCGVTVMPWMERGAVGVFPRGESGKDQLAALSQASAYETRRTIADWCGRADSRSAAL